MEVEIVFEDCIKPSSPTPSHLKIYKLSLLDQFMPCVYVPMILYYSNTNEDLHRDKTLLLKQSLSRTLTQFYPLAGKITDDLSVECNDEGVLYLEARASISLSEFLKHHDITLLQKFLPNHSVPTPGSYVTMIQETFFDCGGFTIGIYILHSVMDGCALASFLKAWGAMACDESDKKMIPSFDGPSVFPNVSDFPRDLNMMALLSNFIRVEKMNAARFVFDGSSIANLKEKVTRSGVKNPTRVEVVSALLFKSLMAALNSISHNNDDDTPLPLAITHAVNVRRRMLPPFPECSMGNFVCFADTLLCGPHEENQLSNIVCKLKESIAKINYSYVNSIQGDDGLVKLHEKMKEMISAFTSPKFYNGVNYAAFTSWCGFGLYEVDFGWGKPVWTTYAGSYGNVKSPFANHVVLMDARTGNNGIEAWVVSDEEAISMLEGDDELLKHAYLNPTPLTN
ncbi:stemmadenine O-acetyltransferase-like [Mercurialis annua]|uniref:stemmadenine O-acetyltransferase-like n=1 Tax=Mercurialis annua TaxID=3986 RepID=UPI00216043B1|nr:stemmadenine O-acetyltransferase-like [Mercurialis annua]